MGAGAAKRLRELAEATRIESAKATVTICPERGDGVSGGLQLRPFFPTWSLEDRAYGLNFIEACVVSASMRGMTDRDGTSAVDALKSALSFDFFGCSFHRSFHTAMVIFKREFLPYLVAARAAPSDGCLKTLVVKNSIISPKRPLTKKFTNGSGLGPKCINRK